MYSRDDGTIVETGDTIRSPKLAMTLRKIALYGPRVFYTGSVGQGMIQDIKEAGKQSATIYSSTHCTGCPNKMITHFDSSFL